MCMNLRQNLSGDKTEIVEMCGDDNLIEAFVLRCGAGVEES